jgi:hypothetical protein
MFTAPIPFKAEVGIQATFQVYRNSHPPVHFEAIDLRFQIYLVFSKWSTSPKFPLPRYNLSLVRKTFHGRYCFSKYKNKIRTKTQWPRHLDVGAAA